MEAWFTSQDGAQPHRPKRQPSPRPPRQTKKDQDLQKRARVMELLGEPASQDETHFRHSHWRARRQRITEILESIGTHELTLNRWRNCGATAVVEYSAALERFRLRASYCHCRHCEPCMRAKANTIAENLRRRLEQKADGRYRFITFTLAQDNEPLADRIRRLITAFKRLRAMKPWKRRSRGGLFTLEVKLTPAGWHPHLHVIDEGGFIHQRDLADLWHKATGDSFIIDIRQLADPKEAAFYVTKYVTKGVNQEVWQSTDAAQEFVTAMKGVRSVSTYGSWRGLKLTRALNDSTDWTAVCRLDVLLAKMRAGDSWATAVYHALRPPGAADELIRGPPLFPHGRPPPILDLIQ